MSSSSKIPEWLRKTLDHLGLGGDGNEPASLGSGLWGAVYKVTPSMAKKGLELNTKNRNMKWRTIEKYQRDIEAGLWRLSHQGVAFDNRGVLSDGQNRLQAVIDSKKPVNMLIVFGVAEESRISIDTGCTRSALDASKFAGMDTNTVTLGTAKNVHNGYDYLSRPISNAIAIGLLNQYADGLRFLDGAISDVRGVTTSAAVRGAIVRAYYYYECKTNQESADRLARFCQILGDGQYSGVKKDVAASRLRDKLLKEKYYGRKQFAYNLTEKAIDFFMRGQTIRNLVKGDVELFLFEGERQYDAVCVGSASDN